MPKPKAASDREAEQIKTILLQCKGEANAITSRELSRQTGMPTRVVRLAILQLIEDGIPIGASVAGVDGGYYLIQTWGELQANTVILTSRLANIAHRTKALNRAFQTWHDTEKPTQMRML